LRVQDALVARDWLGIAIEVIVVVVGVLIAFQIDQWADGRKQAREERQFLTRLYSEYGRSIAEVREANSEHDEVMSQARAIVAARHSPAVLARYAHENGFGCGIARQPLTTFNDTAYQELVASGRINTISDPELRSDVRELTAEQAAANSRSMFGRDLMFATLPALNAYYESDITADGQPTCRIHWPQLVKDPVALTAVVRGYRVHQQIKDRRQVVLLQTAKVRAEIACKIGRPECRSAPSSN
jgi:hypothetical protein